MVFPAEALPQQPPDASGMVYGWRLSEDSISKSPNKD
jgi:hypothetical protein